MNEVDYIIDLVEKNKEKLIAINKEFYQALVDELSIFIHGGYYDYTGRSISINQWYYCCGAFKIQVILKMQKLSKRIIKIVDRTKLFYKGR